jgi:hypothetical protein
MSTCEHKWQKVYEVSHVGSPFPIGFRCKGCNRFVGTADLPVTGLPGIDTGEKVLVGVHGGRGNCSDGTQFREQIAYPDGRLEIIR